MREEVARREEALDAFEGRLALVPYQCVTEFVPGVVPAGGDDRRALRQVLAVKQLESRFGQQLLVRGAVRVHVHTDRASRRDFRTGDKPSHDRRVREQNPGAGRRNPVQLPQDVQPVGEVTHRVDRQGGVEAPLLEWQLSGGVDTQERGALAEAALLRKLGGSGDSFGQDVDADDAYAPCFC